MEEKLSGNLKFCSQKEKQFPFHASYLGAKANVISQHCTGWKKEAVSSTLVQLLSSSRVCSAAPPLTGQRRWRRKRSAQQFSPCCFDAHKPSNSRSSWPNKKKRTEQLLPMNFCFWYNSEIQFLKEKLSPRCNGDEAPNTRVQLLLLLLQCKVL